MTCSVVPLKPGPAQPWIPPDPNRTGPLPWSLDPQESDHMGGPRGHPKSLLGNDLDKARLQVMGET